MLGYQYRYPLDVYTFVIGEFHGNTYIPAYNIGIKVIKFKFSLIVQTFEIQNGEELGYSDRSG